jgi:hypothetical protein
MGTKKKVEPSAKTKKQTDTTTEKNRKQARKTGGYRWSDATIKHAVTQLD